MSEMKLTAAEVDALEVSIRLQLGGIAKSRQLTETVVVHGPTVLSLIAAARELEAAKTQAWDVGFLDGQTAKEGWGRRANPYRQPKGPTK